MEINYSSITRLPTVMQKKIMLHFFCMLIFIFIIACTSNQDKQSNGIIKAGNTILIDSSSAKKSLLTKIYIQAIAEFIKAVDKKDKTRFDTLFFGKHVYGQPDDFPDIQLPETIEQTNIQLLSPENGLIKQKERFSLVYINLMGWLEKESAAFIFVVFSNGGQHQFDYIIDFTVTNNGEAIDLKKIEFEDYRAIKNETPERILLYHHKKWLLN